jgi:hypothetical protein
MSLYNTYGGQEIPQWKEMIVSIWKDATCTATQLLSEISLT